MKRNNKDDGWRINLALTAGVMATVLIALVMMQLDALQAQRPQTGRLVIANVQATAVANGAQINLPFGALAEVVAQIDPNATIAPDINPRTSDTGAGAAAEFPVCGEVPAGWLLYTTVSGDTIALLAAATQTDPNAILAANCLANDALAAGMQILLPGGPDVGLQCGPPQNWLRYQVRAGDTMAALAGSRNTTVAEVLRANCRDSEALTAGQMIFLPPGGATFPSAVTSPPNTAPPAVPSPVPPTASPLPVATTAPPQPPPNPTPVPPIVPTNVPLPTSVIPTIPVVPTSSRPTATPPSGFTATPPVLPTAPPTAVPPTSTIPAPTATTVLPTPVPPTATLPRPTNTPVPLPTNTPPSPPTNTPPPPPTNTPVPPPTNTPEPPPTNTPEPPPPDTPVPEPSATPEPGPALGSYGLIVWQRYWR